MKKRLFIAAAIPTEVARETEAIQDQLRHTVRGKLSYTRSGNYHITMHFLGDVDEQDIPVLSTCLREASALPRPLLETVQLDAFPNRQRPSVIIMSIADREKKLLTVYQKLADKLEKLGFKTEKRPFRPHLTLARVRSGRVHIPTIESSRRFYANEISLVESTLTEHGPHYTKISTVTLSSNA